MYHRLKIREMDSKIMKSLSEYLSVVQQITKRLLQHLQEEPNISSLSIISIHLLRIPIEMSTNS